MSGAADADRKVLVPNGLAIITGCVFVILEAYARGGVRKPPGLPAGEDVVPFYTRLDSSRPGAKDG